MIEDVEMNITDSSESNDSTESLLEINRLPTSCKIFIPKEYYHYEVNKDYLDDFIEFTTENRNITFRDITLKKFTILEMYLPRSSVKFFLNLGLSKEKIKDYHIVKSDDIFGEYFSLKKKRINANIVLGCGCGANSIRFQENIIDEFTLLVDSEFNNYHLIENVLKKYLHDEIKLIKVDEETEIRLHEGLNELVNKFDLYLLGEADIENFVNQDDYDLHKQDIYSLIYNQRDTVLLNFIKAYNDEIKDSTEMCPDLYILIGFKDLPNKYIQLLDKNMTKSKNCNALDNAITSFFSCVQYSKYWYIILTVICITSQLIAPIYYVINYSLEGNSYCPDNSTTINKLFSFVFFFILYTNYSNMWTDIYSVGVLYDRNSIIRSKWFIYLSILMNNMVIFVIPIFTYTLFLENNRVVDLILNCLTGTFLIELDNSLATYCCPKDILNQISRELLVLNYIENGMKVTNLLPPSNLSSVLGLTTVLQVLLTLVLAFGLIRCL